jgi:hypothetical protein
LSIAIYGRIFSPAMKFGPWNIRFIVDVLLRGADANSSQLLARKMDSMAPSQAERLS